MTATTTTLTLSPLALRVGDVIVSRDDSGRQSFRNVVTTAPRSLGGTGLVGFGLTRDGMEWDGRLRASSECEVERAEVPAPALTPNEVAAAYGRATGSVGATYRVERRNADGSLTVEAEGTWTATEEAPHPCVCDHCREAGTCFGCTSGQCP